jgi:GNAT superfamily N-acetyltransferase
LEYQIKKYKAELKEEVISLTRLFWSEDSNLNRSYFEWKYERNPYTETPHLYMGLHQGKVVGMRGLLGARWEVDFSDNAAVILYAGDLIIHPNHRNKNLFSKIMQAAYDDAFEMGHDYVLNLTASPVNFVASMATGWRKTAPVQALIRPASQRLLKCGVRRRLQRLRFLKRVSNSPLLDSKAELQPLSVLDDKDSEFYRRLDSRIKIEKNPRPQAMADLINRRHYDGRIRHIRDVEYFNWRFQNPIMEHRFLYWDEGGLQGYLVLGHTTSKIKDFGTVRLLDWEGVNENIRGDLLNAAINAGKYHEMIVWSASMSSASQDLLNKAGFKPLQNPGEMNHQRPCVLVRAVRDDLLKSEWVFGNKRLLNLDNWDIRLLYGL